MGPKGGGAGETEEGGAGVYVQQFGFPVPTCCGRIPTINDWQSDWVVSQVVAMDMHGLRVCVYYCIYVENTLLVSHVYDCTGIL